MCPNHMFPICTTFINVISGRTVVLFRYVASDGRYKLPEASYLIVFVDICFRSGLYINLKIAFYHILDCMFAPKTVYERNVPVFVSEFQ
jgi:hypothetical protein